MMIRRTSSGGGRLSMAPLRVKSASEANKQGTNPRPRSSAGSQSSLGGRASISGVKKAASSMKPTTSRRSSGYGRNYGHHEKIRDPRPITNKCYKDQCISKLLEFLSSNHYPHPLSSKVLQSPQSKDFLRIFEFMVGYLFPNYKMSTKIEDEVPRLLKLLGYPFTISKSSMFAVGSPHTWPNLLAALTWLREEIEYSMALDIENTLFPAEENDFGKTPKKKTLFAFLEKTYSQFMSGEDTYEEAEEELAQDIRQNGLASVLDELAAENRHLHQELQTLEETPDRIGPLKEQLAVLQVDKLKLENYNAELEMHQQKYVKQSDDLDKELKTLTAEQEALQNDNQRKQRIFDAQELSPVDVERINLGRQDLQRQIKAVETEINDIDQQIWAGEMQMGKINEKIQQQSMEYNKVVQLLRMDPLLEKELANINLNLQPPEMSGRATENVDNINILKSLWSQLKMKLNERIHHAEERKLNDQEAQEQVNEMLSEKQQSLSNLETKLKRLEDSIESLREQMSQESATLRSQLEELQDEIIESRKMKVLSVQEITALLQEEKQKHTKNQVTRRNVEEDYIRFIEKAVALIVNHKQCILNHTESLKSMAAALVEEERKKLKEEGILPAV